MAVNDIRVHFSRAGCDMRACGKVAQPDLPAHGDARKSEGEIGRKLRKPGFGRLSAGRGIRHDAHLVPARDLPTREIDDMAEQAAHRRAHDMEDVERGRIGSAIKSSTRSVCSFPPSAGVPQRLRRGAAAQREGWREIDRLCCVAAH
jgi:hypothetical protein